MGVEGKRTGNSAEFYKRAIKVFYFVGHLKFFSHGGNKVSFSSIANLGLKGIRTHHGFT